MPAWTETNIQEVLTGLWWILVAALGAIGVRAQTNKASEAALPPTKSGEAHIEVAGALIDTKRMDLLIAELGAVQGVMTSLRIMADEAGTRVEANTASTNGLVVAVQMARTAVETHTKASADLHRHTEELAREMRELRNETRELREENRGLRDEILRLGRPR